MLLAAGEVLGGAASTPGSGGGGGRGAQHGSVWGEWVAVGRALLKRSLPYCGSLLQSAAGQENSDSGTVVLLMDVRGS